MITLNIERLLSSRVVASILTASYQRFRGCYAVRSLRLTCPQWSDGGAGAGVSLSLTPSPRLLQCAILPACGVLCLGRGKDACRKWSADKAQSGRVQQG